MPSKLKDILPAARGDVPAYLLFKNARIINVFTGSIDEANVAVSGDRIVGVGNYTCAKKEIDLQGRYLAPGLINGHTHIESSMLDVGEYARAVVPHGTTAVITDLHEIANVSGLAGIEYVMRQARALPLDLFVMAPSCVPATNLETSGAVIGVDEIRELLGWPDCLGLGEVMNYQGVIFGDPTILAKLSLAKGKIVDGHAPGLTGAKLNAYISAGIMSDHESVTYAEGREKLDRGMILMIREGSSEKNLEDLLPLITDQTYKRCCLVVDDRTSVDLQKDGDIDAVIRKAIRLGLDPVRSIQLATINTANYFRIEGSGAVAPGYLANLMVLDDLENLKISAVYHRGKMVASHGKPLFSVQGCEDEDLRHSIRIKPFDLSALKIRSKNDTYPVIKVVPGQIVTHYSSEKMPDQNGFVESFLMRDILKLVVVERHKFTGHIGLGFVSGFGLKKGALASSVAHDSHNIVAVGVTDEDIYMAVKSVEAMQGGLVAVAEKKVLASLAAPIAGLLSCRPVEIVASAMEDLENCARSLGSSLHSPFAALSFLALPVIPELRLTDLGLVDVNKFELIDL